MLESVSYVNERCTHFTYSSYNFIIMESTTRDLYMKNAVNDTAVGAAHKFQTDNAYSHIVSASVSYSF